MQSALLKNSCFATLVASCCIGYDTYTAGVTLYERTLRHHLLRAANCCIGYDTYTTGTFIHMKAN